MDQFFNWAPTLIQEFNEIDSQLVDSNDLFDFMGAVGEIEQWDPKEKDGLKRKHLDFQNHQFSIFFFKNLIDWSLISRKMAFCIVLS